MTGTHAFNLFATISCEDPGWSNYFVIRRGNDLVKPCLKYYISLCACVYFAYYRGSFFLWLGLAVTSNVVKTLLRLLLFTLSTSSDPRNISSSLMSELFSCLTPVWCCTSCTWFPFWQAEMTAFMAIVTSTPLARQFLSPVWDSLPHRPYSCLSLFSHDVRINAEHERVFQ